MPPVPAHRVAVETVADVELLVRRFYQAVIPDSLFGPIFHEMGVDWSVHIPLVDFWGRPFARGAGLPREPGRGPSAGA